ncbi:MAG: thiamine diphosphokinase [Hydrogenoanaerobacterium sp.]
MKRCIIIAAHMQSKISRVVNLREDDFIICADGGYMAAVAEGITPSLVIGDFDSFTEEIPSHIPQERVPPEKDDTDTMLCLKRGIELGYDEFIILGGMGGRLDHTFANLQTLAYGAGRGCFVLLAEEKNLAVVISDETVRIPRMDGWKLSVFALGDNCDGVCESGVKYPLQNATVTNNFPIGVSNEFVAEEAVISCGKGRLLIILSRD